MKHRQIWKKINTRTIYCPSVDLPWPDLDQTRIGGCSLGSLRRGVGRLITKRCISGSFRPFPDFFWTLIVAHPGQIKIFKNQHVCSCGKKLSTARKLSFSERSYISGLSFQVFWCPWIGPPPSPWTDASGLSVDASGLVPPPSSLEGGGRGGQSLNYYKMYNIVCTMLNNHGIT